MSIKMNKNLIISVVCIMIFLIVGGVVYMAFFNKPDDKVNEFSLSEYNNYIENFSSDKILGKIDNEKIAKEKAESVWIDLYGEQIKREKKPYIVSFDPNNEVWLVTGSLPKNMLGGVPYIIIQKHDGKVLAVWHDK